MTRDDGEDYRRPGMTGITKDEEGSLGMTGMTKMTRDD